MGPSKAAATSLGLVPLCPSRPRRRARRGSRPAGGARGGGRGPAALRERRRLWDAVLRQRRGARSPWGGREEVVGRSEQGRHVAGCFRGSEQNGPASEKLSEKIGVFHYVKPVNNVKQHTTCTTSRKGRSFLASCHFVWLLFEGALDPLRMVHERTGAKRVNVILQTVLFR